MNLLNIDGVNSPEKIKLQLEKQAEEQWVTGAFRGAMPPRGEFIFLLKEAPSGIM